MSKMAIPLRSPYHGHYWSDTKRISTRFAADCTTFARVAELCVCRRRAIRRSRAWFSITFVGGGWCADANVDANRISPGCPDVGDPGAAGVRAVLPLSRWMVE